MFGPSVRAKKERNRNSSSKNRENLRQVYSRDALYIRKRMMMKRWKKKIEQNEGRAPKEDYELK